MTTEFYVFVMNAIGVAYAAVQATQFRFEAVSKLRDLSSPLLVEQRTRVILSKLLLDHTLHFMGRVSREDMEVEKQKKAEDKMRIFKVRWCSPFKEVGVRMFCCAWQEVQDVLVWSMAKFPESAMVHVTIARFLMHFRCNSFLAHVQLAAAAVSRMFT